MADGWHVVSQVQRQTFGAGGQLQTVMAVTFQTNHGVRGTVDVPLAMFTPDHVRDLIDAYVANIDGVHNL